MEATCTKCGRVEMVCCTDRGNENPVCVECCVHHPHDEHCPVCDEERARNESPPPGLFCQSACGVELDSYTEGYDE